MADIDVSELVELSEDMQAAYDKTYRAVRATTIRAAKNIERGAKALAPGGPRLKHYAGSITTEIRESGGTVEGEVGPLQSGRGGQGAFGQFLEFGGATSPPYPHLMPAAEDELPNWQRYLEEAAQDVI